MLHEVLVELQQFGFKLNGVAVLANGDCAGIGGQVRLHTGDAGRVFGGDGLLQFGGESRRHVDALVMRCFEVGQVAGDGLMPQRRGIEHLLGGDVIGLVEQAVDHVKDIQRDV